MSEVESVYAVTTDFNADSVEWCPVPQLTQYLACATYHLDEGQTGDDGSQVRNGNITLHKLSSSPDLKLEKTSVLDTGGVLDMKWYPRPLQGGAVLGVACSDGRIVLSKLTAGEDSEGLKSFGGFDCAKEERNMVLSLDWADQEDGSMTLVASDTLGNVNYLCLREGELVLKEKWKAHSFEAWITAFDYTRPHIIFSGGDDCCFKCWDVRNTSNAVFVNKRHSMGVTSISKSKLNENLLVTGSYDENVFLWDTRKMKSPVSEICLGGGIWRLKWHPNNPKYLCTASMHNGFHVLSVQNDTLTLENHYNKHESLAYGVDWSSYPVNTLEDGRQPNSLHNIIASCSFYDKLLHVWTINL